jgi:hypothetical protein
MSYINPILTFTFSTFVISIVIRLVMQVYINAEFKSRQILRGFAAFTASIVFGFTLFVVSANIFYGGILSYSNSLLNENTKAKYISFIMFWFIPFYEEVAKFLFSRFFYGLRNDSPVSTKNTILVGCSFGVFEFMLYSVGFFGQNYPLQLSNFLIDFALQLAGFSLGIVLHSITCIFYCDFLVNRKFYASGLVIGISIHLLYNALLGPFFYRVTQNPNWSILLLSGVGMFIFAGFGLWLRKKVTNLEIS